MTTIQLQRIIGVALLFSVVIGIAMLLIRSAGDGVAIDNTEEILNLGFEEHNAAITEPYVSEAIINVEPAAEHSNALALAQTEIKTNTIVAPAKVVTPAPAKVVAAAPTPAPAKVIAAAPTPAPAKVVAAAPTPAPAKVVAAVPTPAKIINEVVSPEMWIIQLASFSVKANADALNLQAQEMGYKSIIENSDSVNGEIYRVRIAPMADKQKAQTIAADLNKKLSLSTQVFQQ